MKIADNYPLLSHNTFHIDVKAHQFIEYDTIEELQHLFSHKDLLTYPILHIGEGSNLLFTKDYEGTVLHSAIHYIQIIREDEEYVEIKAGSGVLWDDFVQYCIQHNWQGAENLSLIPGEVGASAIQNIGAYGVEVKDLITEVEALDTSLQTMKIFKNADCNYAYRSSIFKQELKGKYIVTGVTFRLRKKPLFNLSYGLLNEETQKLGDVCLANIRKAVIAIRESKLPNPAVLGNAGSFFMNPVIEYDFFNRLQKEHPEMPHYLLPDNKVKIPAGWLIEQCGWKGKQLGRVAVHEKQALVIVNTGNATGLEILDFSQQIVTTVKEKFGITIVPEVAII